jgi:hypothetical protein
VADWSDEQLLVSQRADPKPSRPPVRKKVGRGLPMIAPHLGGMDSRNCFVLRN